MLSGAFVLLGADEPAVGVEEDLELEDVAPQLLVGDLEAEALGLLDQDLAVDEAVQGLHWEPQLLGELR